MVSILRGAGLKNAAGRLLKSGIFRRLVNPEFGRATHVSNGAVCLDLSLANRLGDLVIHNFLIQQLESWGYSVHLAVSASFYRQLTDFFHNHCLTDRVLVLPAAGKGKAWLSFIGKVKKAKIRCVIVDQYPMVNPLAFYLAGVPMILGVEGTNTTFCSREYRLDKANTHYTQLVSSILHLLEPGVTRTNKHTIRPFFPFRPVTLPQLGRQGGHLLAVHMGGSNHWNRKWPLEKFVMLCQLYLDNHDGQLAFIGGKEEHATAESVKAILEANGGGEGRVFNYCGSDLNTTAAILSRCDVFLGNDSAPMHIANALNKRVIVIYGPSAYNAVNPRDYDPRNITVRLGLECIPCLDRECRLPDNKKLSCLKDLQVETLWDHLCSVLQPSLKTVIK